MKETKGCKAIEVYSRVVGFYRPVKLWNKGKKDEFENRKEFVNKGKITKKDVV